MGFVDVEWFLMVFDLGCGDGGYVFIFVEWGCFF